MVLKMSWFRKECIVCSSINKIREPEDFDEGFYGFRCWNCGNTWALDLYTVTPIKILEGYSVKELEEDE